MKHTKPFARMTVYEQRHFLTDGITAANDLSVLRGNLADWLWWLLENAYQTDYEIEYLKPKSKGR